jgi:hypothetical protein
LIQTGLASTSSSSRPEFTTLTDEAQKVLLLPLCLVSPKKLSHFKRDVPHHQMTVTELLFELQGAGWKEKPRPSRGTAPPRTKRSAKVMYVDGAVPPFRTYLQALLRSNSLVEVHHFQLEA